MDITSLRERIKNRITKEYERNLKLLASCDDRLLITIETELRKKNNLKGKRHPVKSK